MIDIISKYENQSSFVNSIETDYKAEVIIAGLLEGGLSPDHIYMIREGNAERGYSKDIAYLRTEYFLRRQTKYLGLRVNRQGLYDILPEGIFHKSTGNPFQKDVTDIIKEIEKQRKEEQVAKMFFRPFEVSASNALIHAQLFERKIDKKRTNRNFVNIFSRYWPILSLLPLNKAVLFIEIISVVADIGHKIEFSAQIISALLDVPVKITQGNRPCSRISKGVVPRLKNMRLGLNAIIGKTYEEEYENIIVRLGPMSSERIVYYNKDNNGKKIIKYLSDALLPADRKAYFRYIPLHEEARCIISSDKNRASSLGVNSFINIKKQANESKE